MEKLIGLVGLIVLLLIAFALSNNRKHIPIRLVVIGLGLQFLIALLVIGVPSLGWSGPLGFAFDWANQAVVSLLSMTQEGSLFIFGELAKSDKLGFIFAFQVLPTIIFVASLMAVLYHIGIMQKIVGAIALVMQKTLGTSGAESLSVAANVFVGQTEAPLVIKPYIRKMTESEIFSLMVGGMATVAGGVLAAYVGLLISRIPDIAGHLLTASLMSAPAALAIAKIMIPERDKPETLGQVPKTDHSDKASNVIEAAANGAADGLKLALNVAAMLLAFIALIALVNAILGGIGSVISFESWGQFLVPEQMKAEELRLSFELILAWIFAPLAWLMGIPWNEAFVAGSMLGEKIVLNEFVAYLHLSEAAANLSDRTVIILSYALCGFANFSSIAIQIGGIGGLAPERKSDLARLGIKSVVGGTLAAFLTATIAGLLI